MSMLARTRAKFLIMALLVGVIAFAVVEGLYWWRHVTVTSAWVGADFTVMGSGVNGRIKRIDVKKGDRVKAGALLATMDSEIAELDAVSLEADLDQAQAQKALVESELAAFQQDVRDQIKTQQTVLGLQRRELETLKRRMGIAQSTMDRNAKLIRRQVTVSWRSPANSVTSKPRCRQSGAKSPNSKARQHRKPSSDHAST